MKKIGRNEPCHYGSGKKYKKCRGNPLNDAITLQRPQGQNIPQEIKSALEKHYASELLRRQQQGLGKLYLP